MAQQLSLNKIFSCFYEHTHTHLYTHTQMIQCSSSYQSMLSLMVSGLYQYWPVVLWHLFKDFLCLKGQFKGYGGRISDFKHTLLRDKYESIRGKEVCFINTREKNITPARAEIFNKIPINT